MKKLLLLVAFCFFTVFKISAQANVYHAFPDSNGFWQYKHTNAFNPNAHDQHRLGLKGDTIINTMTYHKVYSLFDSTLNSPWSTYYAAIREQNKQVFAKFGNNDETLLYDFNLLVGDTIRYTYCITTGLQDTSHSVLTKIDSVLLKDGKYRKRYTFDPASFAGGTLTDTVIEGLGSNMWQGLFDPLLRFCTCGDGYGVTCIKTYDTTRYLLNSDCDHCFCTFLTPVAGITGFSGKISPNPFSDKTTLSFSRELNNATLTVYDAAGRQMTVLKNINGQTLSVSRNEIPAGVYLMELKEGNTVLAKEKIIVSD